MESRIRRRILLVALACIAIFGVGEPASAEGTVCWACAVGCSEFWAELACSNQCLEPGLQPQTCGEETAWCYPDEYVVRCEDDPF